MAQSNGLRDRVHHALLASVGIFSLALTFWGVQAYQQSEAAQTDQNTAADSSFLVTPTTGTIPLTVTGSYTKGDHQGSLETINFEGHGDGIVITDQYKDKGVTFSSSAGNVHTRVNNAGCSATGGTEATSPPYFLIGQTHGVQPITFEFTKPVNVVKFQAISVGANTLTASFFNAAGQTIHQKTVGPNTGSESGDCNHDPVSYTGTQSISRVTVDVSTIVTNADWYGIDDLEFGLDPSVIGTLEWNFGDGTIITAGKPTETHTYTKAGTYAVTLKEEGTQVGTATVTATDAATAETTLTTSKASYTAGETVQFTLTNKGPADVTLLNSAPFTITQGSKTILAPVALQVIETLKANQSSSWTWNQKDSAGVQVGAGPYVVTVKYKVGDAEQSKTASFTIQAPTPTPPPATPPATPPINQGGSGSFSVSPTSGTTPLTVTFACTGDTIAGIVIDWGDGVVQENVTCPTKLSHTFAKAGSYTISLRKDAKVLGSQVIVASAPSTSLANATTETKKDDGKGAAPSALASTGSNLLLVLLIAALVSGVISYFIIRRPFHTRA